VSSPKFLMWKVISRSWIMC